MAASAFKHSKLSVVKLDTAAGVLTDISDSCDSCDFDETQDLVKTTTFGATSETYITGFADGKIKIGGSWNRTLHQHLSGLKEAFRDGTINSASFEYGPEGTTAGCIKLTCEIVQVGFKKTSKVKDQVMWDGELQITGAVTESTY